MMFSQADVKIARSLSQLTIPDILNTFGVEEPQSDAFYEDVADYVNVFKNYPDMFAIGVDVFHPYLVTLAISQLKNDSSFTTKQRQYMIQLESQLVDSIKSKYEKMPIINARGTRGGGCFTRGSKGNSSCNLSEGLVFGPPIYNNITNPNASPFEEVVRYKGNKPENLRNYIWGKIKEVRDIVDTQMRKPRGRRQVKTRLNFLFEVDRKIDAVLTRLEKVQGFSAKEAEEFKLELATLDATLTELNNLDDVFSTITQKYYTVNGEERATSLIVYSFGVQILRNNMEEARSLIGEHTSDLMSEFDKLNEPIVPIIDHIKHIFTEERHWWKIKLETTLSSDKFGFDNFDELYIDPNGGKGLDKEIYYTEVNSKLLLWNSFQQKTQITAEKAGDYRKTLRNSLSCAAGLCIGAVMYYNDVFSVVGSALTAATPALMLSASQGIMAAERVAGKFFNATARLPSVTQERLADAVVGLVDGKATVRSVAGVAVTTYAATLKQISESLPSVVERKIRLQIAGQKSLERIKYDEAVRTIRLDPSQYIRGRKEIATAIASLRSEISTLEAQMVAALSPELRAAKGAEITAKMNQIQIIGSSIPCDSERIDPFWSVSAWVSSSSSMSAAERARIEVCIKEAIERTALANFRTSLMTYAEVQSHLFDEADAFLRSDPRGLARLSENTEKRTPEQLKSHIRGLVMDAVTELEGPKVPVSVNTIEEAKEEVLAANAAAKAAAELAKEAQEKANSAAAAAKQYNKGPMPGSSANPAEEHSARSAVPQTAVQARVAAREAEAAKGRAAAAALRLQAAEGKFARPMPTSRGGSRKTRGTRKIGGAGILGTGMVDIFMGAVRSLAILTKAGLEIDNDRKQEAETLANRAVTTSMVGRVQMAERERLEKKYVNDSSNVIQRTVGLGVASIGTMAAVAYSGDKTEAIKMVSQAADAAALFGIAPTLTKIVKNVSESKADTILSTVGEFVKNKDNAPDVQEVVRVIREEGVFASRLTTIVPAAPVLKAEPVRQPIKRRGLLNISFNSPQPVPAAMAKPVAPTTAIAAAPKPVAPTASVATPFVATAPVPVPSAIASASVPVPTAPVPTQVLFDVDNPKTTIPMIKQKIIELSLDVTEEQLKEAKTKSLLIKLFKEAYAKKGLLAQATVPQANVPRAPVPHVNVPQVNVPQVNLPRAPVPQANLPQANLPQANLPQANVPRAILLKIAAEEAKAEHQGDPDDDDKKAKAIAAAVKMGMTEDEAEDWLGEPLEGGKRKMRKTRKTRKFSGRRSNRTRKN